MLTISVEDIDFDTQVSLFNRFSFCLKNLLTLVFKACKLRLKGRNIEENDHVKMGAYHTIDLELNRKFTLKKYDKMSFESFQIK